MPMPSVFAKYDAARAKPRLNTTIEPEERAMADALAEAKGISIAQLLGQLLRREWERFQRKEGAAKKSTRETK